jgi:probable HAF family extracellular repeat protein
MRANLLTLLAGVYLCVATAIATPPSVQIAQPNDGAVFWTIEAVVVSVNAQDQDGTVTEVSLQLDGNPAGLVKTVPYQFNVGPLSVGTHQLTAHALDNNGEVGVSATISIFVEEPPPTNTPPSVRIIAPGNGTEFVAPMDVLLQVDARDPDVHGRVTQVEFYSGSTWMGQTTNAPFSFNLSNLGVGEYTVFARATDNRYATADSIPITFRIVATNPPSYTLVELGTFGGIDQESGGINNLDEAAGSGQQSNGLWRAFRAHDGVLQNLGTLSNGESRGVAINDSSAVIGYVYFGGGSSTKPFLWKSNSGLVELPGLGDIHTRALAINNAGTVVGSADRDGGAAALIWENGQVHDLLAPRRGVANAINTSGQIGGGYQEAAWGLYNPFILSNGVLTTLPRLSDFGAMVNGLNDSGVAVGYAVNSENQPRAVLWQTNNLRLLSTFGGNFSSAVAINEDSAVIGMAEDTQRARPPFVWKEGVMYNLQKLITTPTDLVLTSVSGINKAGTIAGVGVRNQGGTFVSRAVLLRPIVPTTNRPPGIALNLPDTITIESDDALLIPSEPTDADGLVKLVQFFANGQLIGRETNSPFTFRWSAPKAGNVCFQAVATDDQGASTSSAQACVDISIVPTTKPEFVFLDLGILHQRESFGEAINDAGNIVGSGRNDQGYFDGFSYEAGQSRFLGLGSGSSGLTLNNKGAIGGYAGNRGFILNSGQTQFLEYGSFTIVRRLNEAGWAIGEGRNSSGSEDPFLLRGTNTLFFSDGATGLVRALNDSGTIVGYSGTGAYRYDTTNGFTWYTPDKLAAALDINNKGEIVGFNQNEQGYTRAILLKEGAFVPLPSLGGLHSQAVALNESGEIVGTSEDQNSNSRACIWSKGVIYDLQTRVRNVSNWQFLEAKGINERGDIVGTGLPFFADSRHAFLLKRLPQADQTNELPRIDWISPNGTNRYLAGETIPIEVAAWDPSDEVTNVEFYAGTILLGNSAHRPFRFNWTNLPPGRFELTAKATDFFGASQTSVPLVVDVAEINPNAPAVAIMASSGDAAINDVRLNVRKSGLFRRVDVIQVRRDDPMPTASQLAGYDAILLYSEDLFNNGIILGNLLADYLDAGHGLVVAPFADVRTFSLIEGRLLTGGYLPFRNSAPGADALMTLSKELPQHPILKGINSLEAQYAARVGLDMAPDLEHIARWSNGDPLVAARQPTAGRIVGLNVFPVSSAIYPDSWRTSTDGGLLLANSLLWACNLPSPLTVAMTSPVNNSTTNPGAALTLTADAQSTDSQVTRIDFYDGGTLIGTATNAPFSMLWTPTLVKTNVLTAVARDAKGRDAISPPVFVKVSSRITVTLTQPVEGAKLYTPTDVQFAGTASDLDGQITKVEFYVAIAGGQDRMGISTNPPYTAIWKDAGVGNYQMFARAFDSLGAIEDSPRVNVQIINRANPVSTTWITGSNSWHQSVNWSAGVPRIQDPASIQNGGTAVMSGPGYARELTIAGQGSGNLLFDGGALTVSNVVVLADAPGSHANLMLESGSIMSKELHIGLSGTGSFTQNSGEVKADTMSLGGNIGGHGTYNLNAGELQGGLEVIGALADGLLNQTGGTNRASAIWLGNRSGATGTYQLEGGQLVTAGESVGSSSGLGKILQSGGNNRISGQLQIGGFGTGDYQFMGGSVDADELLLGVTSVGTLKIEGDSDLSVRGRFALGEYGLIRSDSGASVRLTGSFDNLQTQRASIGSTTNITLVIETNQGWTELEASSNPSLGFSNNYAWATLQLNDGGRARLVNRRANASSGSPEAFMSHDLTMSPSSVLDLNGLNFYLQSPSISIGGNVLINSGALGLSKDGEISSTGRITGPGVIIGAISNNGQVDLAGNNGRLDVTGSYVQNSNGTLTLRLGGMGAGTEYQFLNVAGTAQLDGTLRVQPASGFVPPLGTQFRLIESQQRSGRFYSVEVQNPPGVALQLSYTPGGAVLQAVTPPVLSTLRPPALNTNTGHYEQLVEIRNPGTNVIFALRLYVEGLPTGVQLLTVSSSEAGKQFVLLNDGLAAGAATSILLEFSGGSFTPILTAAIAHIGEATSRGGELFSVAGEKQSESFALRFPTLPQRIYYVQYSTDMQEWKTSQPAIIGTGSQAQWIDFGPPRTDIPPRSSGNRYYRLLLLP